jgi:Peptidase A4 family
MSDPDNVGPGSPHQRPRQRGPRGLRRNRSIGWLVALAASVPVIFIGFYLANPAPSHLATSADSQNVGGGQGGQGGQGGGQGGWGRGGYTMMPGPSGAGSATSGSPVQNATNATDATSANWSGYAATGQEGSLTSVSASWTQPAVTCGDSSTFSSFWVGLDGDGTATVEQTGTEADCANGTASYQGWYEIFPAAPVFYQNPVEPADAMSASVVSDGNGLFTLTLSDATQGWTQTTQQSEPNAELGSAEIIAEAPSNGEEVLPLADFGTVNFSNADVDGQPVGDQANLTEITMASDSTTLATPTALTGGNAFSITAASSSQGSGGGQGGGGGGGQGGSGGGGQGGSGGGQGSGGGGGGHHHHHDGLGGDNGWGSLGG